MSAKLFYLLDVRRPTTGRRALLSVLGVSLFVAGVSGCAGSPTVPVATPTENPSVEAETRLWYQANSAFSDGRYSAAIHLYERYLTTYPKSRRANEAHWELGQSYEQMGEVTGALKEYRILAGPEGAPVSSQSVYAERALHRIEALRNQATVPAGARSGHTALYVSFSNLPPMAQVESWVRQLSAQGVSAILVDASLESSFTRPPTPTVAPTSTPLPTLPTGALFATSQGPVMTDWFGVLVPQAHEVGMSVFAVLDLFRAPLSDHRQESRMLLYDPTRRKVHPWTQFDLLAPPVQQELAQLLADLVRSGVDGMVFRARAENSFAYEVSDGVLRQFEAQVRQPSSEVAQALRERMTVRQDAGALASDKTLWRWVGWKARQELDVLARLKKYVQKAVPRLRMVLEIHPEALSNPTSALVNYGEDAAEARRRGFDLLLGGPSREASDVRAFGGSFKGWSRDVIQSEKGEPQTLPQGWVLLRTPGEHGGGMFTGLAQQADELRTPDIRHLVFVPDAAPAVP
ncbi:MAG: tetratricopeptide repeat protein [Nitrospira sp.]|nr:tetratricopeptide repeat protein [Nitrospira sp.]MDR4476957.1 tetratricopeptide repeat protein [Nitrospira sp.]